MAKQKGRKNDTKVCFCVQFPTPALFFKSSEDMCCFMEENGMPVWLWAAVVYALQAVACVCSKTGLPAHGKPREWANAMPCGEKRWANL